MFKKFKTLPKQSRVGIVTVAAVVGLVAIGTTNQPKQANLQLQATNDKTNPQNAQSNHPASTKKAPVITTKTTTETQPIPFTSTTVQDSSLAKGTTKITTVGVNGVSTLTYKVTSTDGVQTGKDLVSQVTTTQPIAQVTSVGTYVAPSKPACDPNYSGACVPNVYPSDVDCAGGSGNGPYYVQGPVYVIGNDIYGLDRDGNTIGCE